MSRHRRKHLTRRWARSLRPIKFGQTRGGICAAALLVAAWQLAAPAAARQENPGYSENDFFRLDWEYDLSGGYGKITITNLHPNTSFLLLTPLEFTTFGLEFDEILIDRNTGRFDVEPIGNDFRYSLRGDLYVGPLLGNVRNIDVTFPSVGVGLQSTYLDYAGTGSATHGPFIIPPSSMNFVSIKAVVPEPSGAASLLLGAIVAGAVARRRS